MLTALRVPADNPRGPLYMDQALAAIHQANPGRLPFQLQMARQGETVGLYCRFPDELRAVVEGQLYAQYPDCHIGSLADDALEPPAGHRSWTVDLRLCPDLFPLKRYPQFEDALNRLTADPLTSLLTTLVRDRGDRLQARIEIHLRPARSYRCVRAYSCLRRMASPFFQAHPRLAHLYLTAALSRWLLPRILAWALARLGGAHDVSSLPGIPSMSSDRLHQREEDFQGASDKLRRFLFETRILLVVSAPEDAAAQAYRKLREMTGAFGQFSTPRLASFRVSRIRRGGRRRWPRCSWYFLLSTEEVATLWHPPTVVVRAPTMSIVESREFEPPPTLPTQGRHPDLAVLGVTSFRSRRQPFGILPDDRRRHLAVLGKTGMGKSTLLHHLIACDIRAGRGVGLIDPHGDLTEALLNVIPRQRTNDVVLFDAGDTDFPVAFNVLSCPNREQRPLVASGVVSAFKKLYGDSWGPRLEHILRNALLTLLEVPGTSLVSLLRLLSDAGYRKRLVDRLDDPVVRTFWQHEFAGLPPKLQAEAIAPIQNKVGHFVSSPLLRRLVGQAQNHIDLRDIIDDGRILLVNLSKGRIGDDASTLLGSLLVSSLQLAAMGRSAVPEETRRDFFLYVDEFQNFATESFATILSEARKYRLNLTIANQYLAQLDEATAGAVFGNVGTLAVFQVGANDAEILTEQLGGGLTTQDLMALPRYAAFVRLLSDGLPSRPFSMRTLPPPARLTDPHRPAIIRRTSRQRYAQPLATVDGEISRAFSAG